MDPGLKGGIAILEANGDRPLVLEPMPILRPGKRGRDQYDVARIRELLRRAKATGSCRAFLEKLHPLPPDLARGAIANYNRGAGFWALVFAFGMLEIPFVPVLPRV